MFCKILTRKSARRVWRLTTSLWYRSTTLWPRTAIALRLHTNPRVVAHWPFISGPQMQIPQLSLPQHNMALVKQGAQVFHAVGKMCTLLVGSHHTAPPRFKGRVFAWTSRLFRAPRSQLWQVIWLGWPMRVMDVTFPHICTALQMRCVQS